ncbi:major facilitator superfamily domain-containing protein, partial [Earliella scabrosa]
KHEPSAVQESIEVEKQDVESCVRSEEGGLTGREGLSNPAIDEARLIRKIDFRVLPVLCVVYLLAFLDRVNISNAVLFGMREDLGLRGNQFNTALVVFFVPYVLFEIPSNALLKHFKPHVWLTLCMALFGLVTLLQGFAQNFSGLVAARFFLGLTECGSLPACYYIVSMWYTRAEAQTRYTFLFSSSALAGAFGGLLAGAIGEMDGARGYRGWRWVFIIEGAFTVIASAVLFFAISDFPEEVKWLDKEEKEFVQGRLYEDVGSSGRHDPLTPTVVLEVLKDWKIILSGFMYLGLITSGYCYAYFAPTIIQTFGYGTIQTQLLSVPPYACAFVLSMAVAAASDRLRVRYVFIVATIVLSLAGFATLLAVHDNRRVQYAALYLVACGNYSAMPIVWADTTSARWVLGSRLALLAVCVTSPRPEAPS